MAEQFVAGLVVDHGDTAFGALEHLAAVLALSHRLVTPAVEEQDGLLVSFKVAADGVFQRKADLPRVAGSQLRPHIHDLDTGQRVASIAFGQPDQLGAAFLSRKVAFGAGVALASRSSAPFSAARWRATSWAEYRGADSER